MIATHHILRIMTKISAKAKKKGVKLRESELKGLLQAVEKEPNPRKKIKLSLVLDKQEEFFGETGSEVRRGCTVTWGNLKRYGIKSYLRVLQQNNVVPGTYTKLEAKAAGIKVVDSECTGNAKRSKDDDEDDDEDEPSFLDLLNGFTVRTL